MAACQRGGHRVLPPQRRIGKCPVRGRLAFSQSRPAAEPSDGFTYDPRDPVMTLYDANGHDAPRDHRLLKRRRDILVYQTDPLERGVEICGYPKVSLWAASSAVDTDFIVRLIDVHPDGFAQNIAYGIVRARWRNGFERPEPLSPGVPTEFEIVLLPIAMLPTSATATTTPAATIVQAGPPDSAGRNEQRLPELRPQPQHRRRRLAGVSPRIGSPNGFAQHRSRFPFGTAGH